MKIVEKNKAIRLRKQGYSLSEISNLLSVSKSTASTWLRGLKLSPKAQIILDEKYTKGQVAAQKIHRSQTQFRLLTAKESAERLVVNLELTSDIKKVLCAMMYWCEGSKTIHDVDFAFTNSDPNMVKTFLTFLRSSFTIEEEKFRVHMHLHTYHDTKTQLDFWAKVTNISKEQFVKAYQKSNTGKHTREGYQGCIRIRYHDVILAREIQAIARALMYQTNKRAIS